MRSGTLATGSYALASSKGQKERIGRMMEMHSNDRQDITHARTGDIVAIAGLKDVTTGDTLCDDKQPIVLERMEFPEPVIKVPPGPPVHPTSPRRWCFAAAMAAGAVAACFGHLEWGPRGAGVEGVSRGRMPVSGPPLASSPPPSAPRRALSRGCGGLWPHWHCGRGEGRASAAAAVGARAGGDRAQH